MELKVKIHKLISPLVFRACHFFCWIWVKILLGGACSSFIWRALHKLCSTKLNCKKIAKSKFSVDQTLPISLYSPSSFSIELSPSLYRYIYMHYTAFWIILYLKDFQTWQHLVLRPETASVPLPHVLLLQMAAASS